MFNRSCVEMDNNPHINTTCLFPITKTVFNWKGDILLCCQDFYEKHKLGNINDQSLMSILTGEKIKKYRSILFEGNRQKVDLCKNCDRYYFFEQVVEECRKEQNNE